MLPFAHTNFQMKKIKMTFNFHVAQCNLGKVKLETKC